VNGCLEKTTYGISRGCSLNPILGSFYLQTLDDALSQKKDVHYVRYMDDILFMTKIRWHNRKAIKLMNLCFNRLKVGQHPEIGRIE